jgi:hypothetical protein
MASKKPDEFTIWLKESIEKMDENMTIGFKDINEHLKTLNGSVARHEMGITALNKWEEDHCTEHAEAKKQINDNENVRYISRMDFWKVIIASIIASILGSGGIIAIFAK